MPQEPQTTFISYSSDDSGVALRLAGDLKAAGAKVWLDQLEIAPGEEWDIAVEQALAQAPRMLLILSPASVKSRNVRNEIARALDDNKAIIPVLCKACTVPLQLQRVLRIDFTTNYENGLKILLRTLGVQQLAAGDAAVPAIAKDTAVDVRYAHERKRAAEQREEEKARPVASKKVLTGLAVGVIVVLTLWILWRRGQGNQASPLQTAVQQPQTQTTVPPTQGTVQQPQTQCPERVYCDPDTNLMWTISDNGQEFTWPDAGQYCKSLHLAGLSGWELPTIDELEKLFDPQSSGIYNIRDPLRLSSPWVWSSTMQGSGFACFNFSSCKRGVSTVIDSYDHRALCVRRSGK